MELLGSLAAVKLVNVSYRGSATTLTDLLREPASHVH
jgi:hypothetical protein